MISWWEFLLLALASFRTFRLLAHDSIFDRPRSFLLGLSGWEEGQPIPVGYRRGIAEFVVCPWCLGFWVSLAWWGAWNVWEDATVVVSVPFALSCVVGLVDVNLDSE